MTSESPTEVLSAGLLATTSVPEPGTIVALAASACGTCGRHEFPVRDDCPACGAAMTPTPLSTSALVAGFTAVNHPPPGAAIEAPYTVAVGAFPEGVAILGPVVGAAFDELAIGDAIETVALDVGSRIGYGFRVVPSAS